MKKAQIGLIPGILREELEEDFWGTVAEVAKVGFQGLEGGRFLSGDAGENRRRMDDLGLSVIGYGTSRERLQNEVDQLIEEANVLGTKNIVLYYAPFKTRDEVLQDAELFDSAGAKLAEAGLRFCYHNHDQEFKNVFDDRYAIDILLEATEPDHVYWELDAAWVLYGGEDPVKFLNKYAGRIPLIHLKDVADINERGKFTAVGTGILDVRSVMETANAIGVEWAVVEQDRPNNLTPMESVVASYLNIKELGLA